MTLSFGDRPVQAVLFDLDDVIVPFQTVRAWQWAWRPQGPPLGERRVASALRTRLRAWDRRRWQGLTGHAPPADLAALHEHLAETLRALAGHALPAGESEAVVRRFLRPAGEIERYEEAPRVLEGLRSAGVTVGILTHLPLESARWLLHRVGLPEELLLSAGDPPGPSVPDPAAFRAAAARLGSTASRTVFVGDLLWSDVHAAQRAGLLALLLDRHGAWPNVQTDRTPELGSLEATLRAGPRAAAPPSADAPGPAASDAGGSRGAFL